jgi:hypothetical protein
MAIRALLTEFVDAHRGARLGSLFGMPAAYAGRRLFAHATDEGLVVRLPLTLARQEIARGAVAHKRGRRSSSGDTLWWVLYRAPTSIEARRLWPILEAAARTAAEGMTA